MKKLLLIFFLAILLQQATFATENDPLISIAIMVKNEAGAIKETLQPFVEAIKSNEKQELAFFIFDTGSTDETISIAENYFKNNHVKNFAIEQEPFIDFATSRNRALELAEKTFPSVPFILMLDAEWILNGVEELIKFCKAHKDDNHVSYLVRIILNSSLDFYTARLIRSRSGVCFVGKVHESLNRASSKKVSSNCFFTFDPGVYGQEKSRRRWLVDIEKLLKEHEKDPQNSRTIFYIAQTYQCLKDLENAKLWYEKRIDNSGWDEENFIASYRLAQVYEQLGDHDSAVCEYLNAFAMRPGRAEPLIRLADHYFQEKDMNLCFLFSRRAAEIPYPEDDILFIDRELYLYKRYDLLGISAWYVKEYELGRSALEKAIEAHPDYPHLYKNLSFYENIL